jgi:hypothetical protein
VDEDIANAPATPPDPPHEPPTKIHVHLPKNRWNAGRLPG